MSPLVVVVFGPVGVGKSTVIERLGQCQTIAGRQVITIREPVEAMIASKALQAVGESRVSSGYDLQMLVLAERLSTYWQAQPTLRSRNPSERPPIIVCDGHMALDSKIFVGEHVRAGRMSMNEMDCHSTAAHVMLAQAPVFAQRPNMYVYLSATAEECLERSRRRGRSEESTLDIDVMKRYVERCDHLAKQLATDPTVITVTIRTGDRTADEVGRAVEHIVQVEASA